MLIQQKTEVIGNKVFRSYKYIRERWTEYFWLFVREGEAIPYFYLPVYRAYAQNGCYNMPTPLAPFGLVIIASYFALWSFWKDVVTMVSKWSNVKRVHELREEFFLQR